MYKCIKYRILFFILFHVLCFCNRLPNALNSIRLASSFNYSTHGLGTKSRNWKNKELKYLKLIRFYIHSTQQSEPILKGPCSTPQLTKRDNSTFCMQWCTLNALLPEEFHWTGKQYKMWTNGVFFNKTFLLLHSYKPLSLSPLSSTYHLTFSQPVKRDLRTFFCWILQQNYL